MPKKEKVLLSWSGGKNSAVSLFEVKSPDYKLNGLIATVYEDDQSLQGHGVSKTLLMKQAEALEIPLLIIPTPRGASSETYQNRMGEFLKPLQKKGLEGLVFGDLSLEDVRAQRERMMGGLGLNAHFPLWKWGSKEALRVFFSLGFKAIVSSVDLKHLPLTFVGREFDQDFLDDIPSGVDPSGERGEFHTFVYDGPFFQRRIELKRGEIIEAGGFGYLELSV